MKQGNYIDAKTGELLNLKILTEHREGSFMYVEQNGLKYLAQLRIRGRTRAVLDCLMAEAKFGNLIPSQANIGTIMNMPSSTINRAFKELLNYRVLIIDNGNYLINPTICWKGSVAKQKATIDKLLKAKVKL